MTKTLKIILGGMAIMQATTLVLLFAVYMEIAPQKTCIKSETLRCEITEQDHISSFDIRSEMKSALSNVENELDDIKTDISDLKLGDYY